MREPLLTERLILRDCTEEDAPALLALDHDPEVMRAVGSPQATDVAAYAERIRTAYMPYQRHAWRGVLLVIDRATDRFLGWVFVRPAPVSRDAEVFGWHDPRDEEIGYRYHPEAWGRGIATEAARAILQVALADPATNTIVAAARIGNHRSQRVLAKLGFRPTGTVTLPGVDDPVVTLSLTRSGARLGPDGD
jgi:RimJ/RimL family protein N-acetyltransferase